MSFESLSVRFPATNDKLDPARSLRAIQIRATWSVVGVCSDRLVGDQLAHGENPTLNDCARVPVHEVTLAYARI